MSARSPLAFKPYLFFSASLPARISAPGALLRHAAGMPSGGGRGVDASVLLVQTRYCQITLCAALKIS